MDKSEILGEIIEADEAITVANALRFAHEQGWLSIQLTNFDSFDEECDCVKCQTLTVVYKFLFQERMTQ